MEFCMFVLVFLFIHFNHCGPVNVQQHRLENDDFGQQPTDDDQNKTDNIEIGSVEILEAPYKSENDEKLYRAIRLNNGLTALLISTPQRHTLVERNGNGTQVHTHQRSAAVSLAVDVGSLSDPRDAQGLAHLIGI